MKTLTMALIMAACLKMTGGEIKIADFETRFTLIGGKQQVGNINSNIDQERAHAGERSLKITIGGQNEAKYGTVGVRLKGARIDYSEVNCIHFYYHGDSSDNHFRVVLNTEIDGKSESWSWKSTIYTYDSTFSTAMDAWQPAVLKFEDFVNTRNPERKFPLEHKNKITYVMFGLEQAGKVEFDPDNKYCFWIDELVFLK